MFKAMFSSSQDVSMMRVCQLLCTLTACATIILCMVFDRKMAECAALIASILTPAFIGKATQSFAERPNATENK